MNYNKQLILLFWSFNTAEWWATFRDEVPHLRSFAKRILSQTTSSSGCERN